MGAFIILSLIWFSFVFYQGMGSVQVSQERAVITYYDPAYIENAQAFTSRVRRGEAYKTNLTMTILHPWGNNVSITLSYKGKLYGTDVYTRGKICDVMKIKWFETYLSKFMETKLTCPMPPGLYGIYNLELPPKDFPFPLPQGEGVIMSTFLKDGKKKIYQSLIKVNILH